MRRGIFALLFVLVFLAFALTMAQVLRADVTPTVRADTHISVIMYGSENNDRWLALEQGIRQACRELEIENPAVNTATAMDTQAQLWLVNREIAAGAKGLIIAAENSDALAAALEKAPLSVPVVFAKNGVPGEARVAADDAGMARALAGRLLAEPGRVVLLTARLERESVRARHLAFREAMQAGGRTVALVDAMPEDLRAGDILVALDTDTLERVIDALEEAGTADARLFGIGSSDRVVHALNQGVLTGVVFQNEYAVGYIATMRLMEKMGLAKPLDSGEIQYMVVDRANMFEPEAEHLLFPIIQ